MDKFFLRAFVSVTIPCLFNFITNEPIIIARIFWIIGFTIRGGATSGREVVINNIATNEIIELAIPFELLGVKPNDEIHCFITVERKGSEIEKWPYRGFIQVTAPTEDFEAMMWQVSLPPYPRTRRKRLP